MTNLTYDQKVKLKLKQKGFDESLYDDFLMNSAIEYSNKSDEGIKHFDIRAFFDMLHYDEKQNMAIQEFNVWCSKGLSLKGCLSFEKYVVDNGLQAGFSKLMSALKDDMPEFKMLGDVRAMPADIVKPQIESEIKEKEQKLETYLRTIFQSMGLDLGDLEDKIVGIINKNLLGRFHFDEMTPDELARFDVSRANPEIIKKQISVCIDKLLAGDSLDGVTLT